jgi:hypothetical protein
LLSRAAQVPQIRPDAVLRRRSIEILPHPAQAGTTTA